MATERDIATLLQTIATAPKGKDMRSAIHDSIELCYSDATSENATKNNPSALPNNTNLNTVYGSSVWLLVLSSNTYSNLPPNVQSSGAPAAFLFSNTVSGWTIQILYTWDDGPIWKRRGRESSGTWERWVDLTQNDKLNALSEVINILLAGVEEQYEIKGSFISSSKSTEQAEINSQGEISMLESGGSLYKVFEYSVNPSKIVSISHTYRAGSVEYCFLDIHNDVINKKDLYVEEYFNDPVTGGSVDTFKRTTLVVVPYDAVKLIVGAASEDGVDPARCTVKYVKSIEESATGGTLVRLDDIEEKVNFYLKNYRCINGSDAIYAPESVIEEGYKYSKSTVASSKAQKTAASAYKICTINDISNIKKFTSNHTEIYNEPNSMMYSPVVFLDQNGTVINQILATFMTDGTSPIAVKNTTTGHWEIDMETVVNSYPTVSKIAFSMPKTTPNESWSVEFWANTQIPVPYGPSMVQFNALTGRVSGLENTTSTSDTVSTLSDRVDDLETELNNLELANGKYDTSLSYYSSVNGAELSVANGVTVEDGYKYGSTWNTSSLSFFEPTKRSNGSYAIYWFNDLTNLKKITSQFSEPSDSLDNGDAHLIGFDSNGNQLFKYWNGFMSSYNDPETHVLCKDTSIDRYVIDIDFMVKKYPSVSKIAITVKPSIQNGSWTVTYYGTSSTPIPYPPSYREFMSLEDRIEDLETDSTISDSINSLSDRISDDESDIASIDNRVTTLETKEWTGKKLVIIGDNISASGSSATVRYFDKIAQSTGIAVTNLSRVGGGYMPSGDESLRFYNRVSSIPSSADAIIIFGSFNDIEAARSNLGDILSSNTTTLYGCVNKALDDIITANPLVPIGVVTPIPTKSHNELQNSEHDTELVNAIIVACNRRGIPVLDLYRCSNLRPWDATFRSLAFSNDQTNGVLPNNEGHAIIAPRIKSFLDSLIKL